MTLIANTRPNGMGIEFAPKVGDFLSETLVTDSRAFIVVQVTEKTVRLVPAGSGEVIQRDNNGSPYPVVWHEVTELPQSVRRNLKPRTVRLRKDGTLRTGQGANPLYPTTRIKGIPVTRTDYSY